ncbi:MAG: hypothetical protein HY901_33850 [Deltaproteobacteria bacterium]|nr:hypothetical protein [Deltaproteobacteria bacterium]
MTDPAPSSPEASYRGVLAANLVSLAIVGWYGVRYLDVALEVRGKVASVFSVPPWYLYSGGLALAAIGALVGAAARIRRVPPQRQVYRLLPVLAVAFLGLHVFVVPPCLLPVHADQIVAAQLEMVESESLLAKDGRFTSQPEQVASALSSYSPPFVGRDGQPLGRWHVMVHSACTGPLSEAPAGTDPGTILYCISTDRSKVWLHALGTGDSLAGGPAFVRAEGRPAVLALSLPSASLPEAASPEAATTSPGEAPDASAPRGRD